MEPLFLITKTNSQDQDGGPNQVRNVYGILLYTVSYGKLKTSEDTPACGDERRQLKKWKRENIKHKTKNLQNQNGVRTIGCKWKGYKNVFTTPLQIWLHMNEKIEKSRWKA